jgi:MFS superfamily sulfate permease-like transporter
MWVITFLITLLLGTQTGIASGLCVSLVMILQRIARPSAGRLGRLPHSNVYQSIDRFPEAEEMKGLLIYRFDGPLYFVNKDFFATNLADCMRAYAIDHRDDDLEIVELNNGQAYKKVNEEEGLDAGDGKESGELERTRSTNIVAVLLDCSCMIDMDVSAAVTFISTATHIKTQGCQLYLACVRGRLRKMLDKVEFEKHVPASSRFVNLEAAVEVLAQRIAPSRSPEAAARAEELNGAEKSVIVGDVPSSPDFNPPPSMLIR